MDGAFLTSCFPGGHSILGGAEPGMQAKCPKLWGFSSSNSGAKTWQLDSDDEEAMLASSVGDYYVEGLCTSFRHTNIIGSYCCYENKAQRGHTASNGLNLPLCLLCSLSVWLGGKTSPASRWSLRLRIELKSQEHEVWPGLSGSTDSCTCPCSSLPQGLQRPGAPILI